MLLNLTVKPETKQFKAQFFNVKTTNSNWVGWRISNVQVTIDNSMRFIKIYSTIPQTIQYTPLKRTLFIGYYLYEGEGIDNKGHSVNVTFQDFKSGLFYLTIEYSDVQYSYSLIATDPD